jgi:beta-lactam-binding protein with PASTA domain
MAIQLKKQLTSALAKKIYLLLALFLVLFFVCNDVVIPWYVNQGGIVKVPSVTGKTYEEAVRILDSVGLEARKGDIRPDRSHPAGYVVIQNPLPDHDVKKGRRVYLSLSGGEQEVVVPNIKGRTLRDARFALEREGLKLGAIEYQPSDQFPMNTIVEQKVAAGAHVKRDIYVSIVVSQGVVAQNITVPDLAGKTLSEAEAILLASGLKRGNVSYAPSNDLLPNTVIEQFPRKGEIVPKDQAIDLVVVQGGEKKKDAFEY